MRRFILVLSTCLSFGFSKAAVAQDFSDFGINDSALAQEFRDAAESIIKSAGTTRGQNPEEFPASAADLLQEAYRTDPDATLDLIERMLRAGTAAN